MDDNHRHPITPPDGLVREWIRKATGPDYEQVIATQAARWGADTELEACCEWLINNQNPRWAAALQEGRRPEPPSLKELALEILGYPKDFWSQEEVDVIRRALEQLND